MTYLFDDLRDDPRTLESDVRENERWAEHVEHMDEERWERLARVEDRHDSTRITEKRGAPLL